MRYHDFRLHGYRVADFGKRITMELFSDYAGEPRHESWIEFSDVALYNFTHTAGAIITEIEEVSLENLLTDERASLEAWNQQQGVGGWKDSIEGYRHFLESEGLKAWRIDSAMGFHGFVVARSVDEVAAA